MPQHDLGSALKRSALDLAREIAAHDPSAYEDDEERVFALLVVTAELYVDLLTESGSLSHSAAVDSTIAGLGENLDIVFAEELTR